ncbi:DNA polymerase III subunit alpha [bacterium]|nr:DNA polymerase III subunit alpha [bacterium]
MKHADFVHIHNHTEFSLLDGALRIKDLVGQALKFHMPAVGITDHGGMFGVLEFYAEAMKNGVKPLIGMEAYIDRGGHTERPQGRLRRKYNHLVLLAKNETGYRNLMQLSTIGFVEGFYYKPRLDMELLREYHEGILATTACLASAPAQCVLAGDMDGARESVIQLSEIFGEGNLYLEVQRHGLEEEERVIAGFRELSRELGVPLVAANDCHYLTREHAAAHDVLLCIQTGKEIDEPNRLRMSSDQYYFRSPDEMRELFSDLPEAYANTVEIAEKCNLSLEFGHVHMPRFPIPEGYENAGAYLAELARAGVRERYPEMTPEVEQRLDKELLLIDEMGFSGYFLIVHDFIREARDRGIPVGPGRGSAAASIVSYGLGITELDPLHFGLVFERFLNPARRSMPDFDIDFCYVRRDEIINYVTEKYGRDSVAQVITFGTMQARAVVRDVGRVLKLSYTEVDRLAKMIPRELNITLDDALRRVPEFRALAASDDRHTKLIEYAKMLEGLIRHASTHAAGVIIAPGKITDWAPLFKTNRDEITTQYAMKSLARIGLLKFDFLGLRTLTVIHDALEMIQENHGVDLKPQDIPLDDEGTFELLSTGHTVGVFQLESSGMRDLVRKMKPERLEDIIATNALFRPGPLRSGMVDDYVKRKHGKQKTTYLHEQLEPVLSETHGVIAYQEQVMQVSSALAGFSMEQADILLNAMRKKVKEVMPQQREDFVTGATGRGVEKKAAEAVFEQMANFAEYGFNKAHSASYAVLAVRTAYLKTHYPAEFMAANLTSEMDNTDRVVVLINECKRMEIPVLPPNIGEGHADFRATQRNDIQFGLGAIKNVGRSAIRSIVKARHEHGEFEDIFDLTARVDLRLVNKRVLESLVYAGALDDLHGHRAQQAAAVPAAVELGQRMQRERESGQTSLFGGGDDETVAIVQPRKLPEAEPWPDSYALAKEKDVLGFYVTGHPLARYGRELKAFATASVAGLREMENKETVRIGGIITEVKTTNDRKGKRMAFVTLEDFTGTTEAVVFAGCYAEHHEALSREAAVIIDGRVSTRGDGDGKIIVNSVVPLSQAMQRFVERVSIELSTAGLDDELLENLKTAFLRHPGRCPVELVLRSANGEDRTVRVGSIRVEPSPALLDALEPLVGETAVHLKGAVNRAAVPEPAF